jgi:hypothetical protein
MILGISACERGAAEKESIFSWQVIGDRGQGRPKNRSAAARCFRRPKQQHKYYRARRRGASSNRRVPQRSGYTHRWLHHVLIWLRTCVVPLRRQRNQKRGSNLS